MKKKIIKVLNLQIKAQEASPNPPIGPALGQHGVNIMEFCKKFNSLSISFDKGTPIPTKIIIYDDKSFEFSQKTPTSSFLILKEINIKKGSSESGKKFVGTINEKQIKNIALIKIKDLTASNIKKAINTLKGTIKSMGIKINK